jgi:ring-1,2-phenylacetyl-CoA epoxidase subunit PaaC
MNRNLLNYTLHLADNALILSQRNSEWTGHGPVLEQDIAISNIALDLIGQARLFYQYAARQQGEAVREDDLAFLRDSWDFKNCLLVELEKGDWAKTTLRQFFFSAYQFYLYEQLIESSDNELSAISEKAFKEATYHLRWSAEWVIRLGDGTSESHRRISDALNDLWRFTGELITPCSYETALAEKKIAADTQGIKEKWIKRVQMVLEEATLQMPGETWMQEGGKEGRHTEALGYILAEMQYLQRTYPNCEW